MDDQGLKLRYYLISPIALSVEKKGVDAVFRVSAFQSVTVSVTKVQPLVCSIYSILNKILYFTDILCKSVIYDTKIYMAIIMDYPVP